MKIVLSVLFLFLIGFISATTLSNSASKPQKGDWVCWYTAVPSANVDCGTYGYSKSKKVAKRKAQMLCEKECNQVCYLDYCEKI